MQTNNKTLTNFSGGELAPELYGRVDLPLYAKGVAKMENFVALSQGGARFRPGTVMVNYTAGNAKARLAEFQFKDNQAYVIEITQNKMRFFTTDGALLEAAINLTWVTNAFPTAVYIQNNAFANGDSVFISGTNTELDDAFYTVAGTVTTKAVITGATQANPGVITAALHGFVDGQQVHISGVFGMTQLNGNNYLVANSTLNTFTLQTLDGTDVDTSAFTAYVSGGVADGGSFTLQDVFGNDVDSAEFKDYVSGGTVARVYTIDSPYQEVDLDNLQWAQNADTMYIVHQNYRPRKLLRTGTQPNFVLSIPIFQGNPFGAAPVDGDGNCPGSVCFIDSSRLLLGGTINHPETVWGSRAPSNENTSFEDFRIGTNPTDSFVFTLAPVGGKVDAIQWMGNNSKYVIIGTYGGTRLLYGASQTEPISPIAITAKPINAFGCQRSKPVVNGTAVMYIQRGGKMMRSIEYDFLSDWYVGKDRTMVANHLFQPGVKQIVAQQGIPDLVWGLRNDGRVIAMTYDQTENVNGWHRHAIGGISLAADGTVASVANVQSIAVMTRPNSIDQLWLSVERVINGSTVRSVEYLSDWVDYPSRQDYYTGDQDSDEAWFNNVAYETQKGAIHLDMVAEFDGTQDTILTIQPYVPAPDPGAICSTQPLSVGADAVLASAYLNAEYFYIENHGKHGLLCMNAARDTLYVGVAIDAFANSQVLKIDVATGLVTAVSAKLLDIQVHRLMLSPDETKLYVYSADQSVGNQKWLTTLDPVTMSTVNNVTQVVPVGVDVGDWHITDDGTLFVFANYLNNTVYMVDANTFVSTNFTVAGLASVESCIFKPGSTNMYIMGLPPAGNLIKIYEYTAAGALVNTWDISASFPALAGPTDRKYPIIVHPGNGKIYGQVAIVVAIGPIVIQHCFFVFDPSTGLVNAVAQPAITQINSQGYGVRYVAASADNTVSPFYAYFTTEGGQLVRIDEAGNVRITTLTYTGLDTSLGWSGLAVDAICGRVYINAQTPTPNYTEAIATASA